MTIEEKVDYLMERIVFLHEAILILERRLDYSEKGVPWPKGERYPLAP